MRYVLAIVLVAGCGHSLRASAGPAARDGTFGAQASIEAATLFFATPGLQWPVGVRAQGGFIGDEATFLLGLTSSIDFGPGFPRELAAKRPRGAASCGIAWRFGSTIGTTENPLGNPHRPGGSGLLRHHVAIGHGSLVPIGPCDPYWGCSGIPMQLRHAGVELSFTQSLGDEPTTMAAEFYVHSAKVPEFDTHSSWFDGGKQ